VSTLDPEALISDLRMHADRFAECKAQASRFAHQIDMLSAKAALETKGASELDAASESLESARADHERAQDSVNQLRSDLKKQEKNYQALSARLDNQRVGLENLSTEQRKMGINWVRRMMDATDPVAMSSHIRKVLDAGETSAQSSDDLLSELVSQCGRELIPINQNAARNPADSHVLGMLRKQIGLATNLDVLKQKVDFLRNHLISGDAWVRQRIENGLSEKAEKFNLSIGILTRLTQIEGAASSQSFRGASSAQRTAYWNDLVKLTRAISEYINGAVRYLLHHELYGDPLKAISETPEFMQLMFGAQRVEDIADSLADTFAASAQLKSRHKAQIRQNLDHPEGMLRVFFQGMLEKMDRSLGRINNHTFVGDVVKRIAADEIGQLKALLGDSDSNTEHSLLNHMQHLLKQEEPSRIKRQLQTLLESKDSRSVETHDAHLTGIDRRMRSRILAVGQRLESKEDAISQTDTDLKQTEEHIEAIRSRLEAACQLRSNTQEALNLAQAKYESAHWMAGQHKLQVQSIRNQHDAIMGELDTLQRHILENPASVARQVFAPGAYGRLVERHLLANNEALQQHMAKNGAAGLYDDAASLLNAVSDVVAWLTAPENADHPHLDDDIVFHEKAMGRVFDQQEGTNRARLTISSRVSASRRSDGTLSIEHMYPSAVGAFEAEEARAQQLQAENQ
jgi:hypothetical protein